MGALAQQGADVDADSLFRRIQSLEAFSTNPKLFTSIARIGILRTSMGLHNTLTSGGAVGYTWQAMFSCPVPFYAVQVLYANASATDFTVLANRYKCVVAATEKASDRTGPFQGGSKVAAFTGLTFGGLAYPNLPAASGFAYNYSLSDVAEVPSYAPTDGTAEYKLMIRNYLNATGIQYLDFQSATTGIRTLTGSDIYADNVGSGDFTASNPGGTLFAADQGLLTSVGAVFHTAQRYATILSVGDSISAGFGTTGSAMGYPIRAKIALNAAGKKVGIIPSGLAISPSAQYIGRAKAIIAAGLQPTFCVFPINTRNDGPGGNNPNVQQTQARISAAVQFAEWLADRGIVPIIVGPTPDTGMVAGVAAYTTLESVGPVIASAVGGAYVSALTLLSSGVDNSYGWANAGDTSDNIHLTDQGAQKLGAAVASAVAAFI